MDYAHPQFLSYRPWLLAYGALWLLLNLQQAHAHARAIQRGLAARFGPAFSLWRSAVKAFLWTAAGWFLLGALATPLGVPIKVESDSRGADVILAVDVSSSMYAQDVPPNRLLAVKSALANFVARLEGDRVGIIAFAGEAVIACPLTTDYDTVALFLEKLETDSVPRDGTGFAPAIKLSLDGFANDTKRGRLIVMATDGEDTLDSDASLEAKRAASLSIPIYTLGVGTVGGAYIPGRPDVFGRVLPKTYQGQPIRVRVNPETLKKIASLSGGEYFEGASPAGLSRAYDRIRSLKQGTAKSQDRYVRDPLYQEPLLIAIVLLLMEALLSNRSGGLRLALAKLLGRFKRLWGARAAVIFLLALPLGLSAFSLDPGRAEYDEGNAAYRQGQYDKATELYQQAIQSKPERMQSHYNFGNTQFMGGDYEGAIKSYEEALKLDPKDADAQYNLDLAQKKLEEKQQDKKGKKGKKDSKDKKNGDQQGQGQSQQQGQGQQKGQGGQKQGQGQPQPGQGGQSSQQNNLNQDQIQAMMNMLKNDQRRFGQAFQPMKKYQKPENQDPVQQLFEQMTGRKMEQPSQNQGGAERKDW
jgi:Ca-activated chloride channel family protein